MPKGIRIEDLYMQQKRTAAQTNNIAKDVTTLGISNIGSIDISSAINSIIASATDNTTFFFPKGTYRLIASSLNINRSNIELKGALGSEIITDQDIHCVHIKGVDGSNRIENIKISGLKITGKDSTSVETPSGLWTGPTGIEIAYANNVEIVKNEISNQPYDGIGIVQPSSNILIEKNHIHNCYDDGINPGGSPSQMTGWVDNFKILNNNVHDIANIGIHHSGYSKDGLTNGNTIRDCGLYGADFRYAKGWTFTENIVKNCGTYGIFTDESFDTTIENNDIDGGVSGIRIEAIETTRFGEPYAPTDITITNNKIKNSSGSALSIYSSLTASRTKGHIVNSNKIINAGSHGINITRADDCIISNNAVNGTGATQNGILLNSSNTNVVLGNSIVSSGGTAISDTGTGNVVVNNV